MRYLIHGLRKIATDWTVAAVQRDIMAAPVTASYWRGEVRELAEAIMEGSVEHTKEEWGDVTLMLQLLLYGKGVPGIGNLRITELTGANSVRKFLARLEVWKRIFEHHRVPFRVVYLKDGGNYAKLRKVYKTFENAGVPESRVDVQWLKREGIVTEP